MQACQRGEEGIEQMLNSWIARIPQESQEILTMLELSCEDNDGEAVSRNNSNNSEHPYLTKSEVGSTPTQNPAVMMKETFAKLVAEGVNPNTAAAKAIDLVAEQQKSNSTVILEAGRLDSIGWKTTASSAPSSEELANLVSILNLPNNKDALQAVLSTTLKYLENARREPWTAKFRSFKLGNKIVDRITRVEGALDLLCSLGLYMYPTETDFVACLPLSADLDEMDASIKELLPESSQE